MGTKAKERYAGINSFLDADLYKGLNESAIREDRQTMMDYTSKVEMILFMNGIDLENEQVRRCVVLTIKAIMNQRLQNRYLEGMGETESIVSLDDVMAERLNKYSKYFAIESKQAVRK